MQKLTIQRTAIIVLFLMLFAMASRIPLDTDMWWHLGSGQKMLTDGGWFYGDPFSSTFEGVYRVNHDWGAQIVMYPIWQVAGLTGMMLFAATAAVLSMYLIYKTMPDNTYLNAILLVLAASAAAVFWSARPQMFTSLFTAFTVYLLYKFKWHKQDRLWMFVPMMFLWGNMHGGFIVGLILLGGMTAGEILNLLIQPEKANTVGWQGVKKLIIVGILGTVVLLLNPYGIDLLLVPFQTFGLQVLRDYIQEWQAPNLTDTVVLPFTFLLILTPISMLLSRRRIDFVEIVLLVGTAYLALTAGRNIAIYAVVSIPIISMHLDEFLQQRRWVVDAVKTPSRLMIRINVVLISVIGFAVFLNVLANAFPNEQEKALKTTFPLDAVAFLQETNPEGEMFNSYNWGGYLIFFRPQDPVFVDGRTDLYKEFVDDYAHVALGEEDYTAMFDEYDINYTLIEASSGLADNLREASDWRIAYEDDLAIVFVREGA